MSLVDERIAAARVANATAPSRLRAPQTNRAGWQKVASATPLT